MMIGHIFRNGALTVLLLGVLTACEPVEQEAAIVPAARVSVVTLEPKSMALTDDWSARVVPVQVAEIRPQVSGVVQRRLFEQGSDVSVGQPLFEINPAPFRAEVDTAEAALQKAESELANARAQSARLESLLRGNSVSRQSYDDAVSKSQQAAAEVAQARATLARRRLDLDFSTVVSPVAGRIDQAMVTEGALVNGSDSSPMARVQRIDQVYVDVRRPSASLETLQEAVSAHASLESGLPVTILGSNGTPYDVIGHILFSGIDVEASTGDVLLRVLVDNPNRHLLPGMFVRARVPYARYENALTVPQQSIVRIGGKPYVWVVGASKQAAMVAVELGELVDGYYRVKGGLTEGQQVVVEGIERLTEGADVSAVAWHGSSPFEASVVSTY